MIGGEFPIAVSDVLNADIRRLQTTDVYTYSSGRAALYQILIYLNKKKNINRILLPDYLCSSVLVPVKALNYEYDFYIIDEFLELKDDVFSKLYQNNTAVLLINYFGLQDLTKQISYIRSLDENAIIIEDDVQAYYEFKKDLNGVDFKFTSLRKTFAVPDGGLVKTLHELPKTEMPNTFGQYKAAAALLKSMREGNFNDQIYLDLFEKGESLIDSELDCGMSQIADKLFNIVDEDRVKVRRLNNARYLLKRIEEIGIKPLLPFNEDKVPLFIPITLSNRDDVRERMFKKEIFCPIHWPPDNIAIKKGKEMSETELSLIIDQRYGQKEMDEIIGVLKND